LHSPLAVSAKASVRYFDKWVKEDLYNKYPELPKEDIVVPDVVDNGEGLSKFPNGSLDFIIANHFIEHCENPIGTISNFFDRLRPGGIVYMAVPDKRFTFDKNRESTSTDHLRNDYQDDGASSRETHYLEYAKYSLANTMAEKGGGGCAR